MRRGTIVRLAEGTDYDDRGRFFRDYSYYSAQGNQREKIIRLSYGALYCCRGCFDVRCRNTVSWNYQRVLLEGILNEVGVLIDGSNKEPGYPIDLFEIIWEPTEENLNLADETD